MKGTKTMAARKTDEQKAAEAAEKAAQEPTGFDLAEPAPKGASVEGMADTDEIEIAHPDTGQVYGVSVKAYRDLYEPLGYKPTRKADNTLLPGDPRTPDPATIPEDAPAPIVVEPSEGEDKAPGDGETES